MRPSTCINPTSNKITVITIKTITQSTMYSYFSSDDGWIIARCPPA